jgi:Ca2+-transporting ATPase
MAIDITKTWHNLTVREVLSSLQTGINGLTREEAQKRLAQFGSNELVGKESISPWVVFLSQFKNFLIIILLIAVALSAILGELADASVIALIVLFACGLGFVQEYRAERAMESLRKMAAPTASVLRDGKDIVIPATLLVPGDVIMIGVGDRIPSDARLVEAVNLKADEASLTGESAPVDKTVQIVAGDVAIADRKNMVYMGTSAVYGRGKAVITSTGMATEFGRIATMLQSVKSQRTPLQVSLDQMGKWIAGGAITLCFILAGIGVARGHEILEMLIWGVSLAVAAVPEALPAVVTIALAIGVQRMVKRNALIRKLPAVETLGCTTIVCSDKTGTLTQDQMTVRQIYIRNDLFDVTGTGYDPRGEFLLKGIPCNPKEDSHLRILLTIGSLCNDARLIQEENKWEIKGDPTEGALISMAAKAGLWQNDLNDRFPRIDEQPFSSESKRMTTVHQTVEGEVTYSKGAPEMILNSCRYILDGEQERELTDDDKQSISSAAQLMAGNALRILAMAYRGLSGGVGQSKVIEEDMVFVGLVGMIDPPRNEVKDAIRLCGQAGVKTVMITGDHKMTAIAIARELGLLKEGEALSGAELDNLDDEEFKAIVEKVEVYARVSPSHKLRVVEMLSSKGHVVAMTGDGVNDAPALKKADIGVAMGITGTDVSIEAADMVLTDDNFISIVAAIEEGRAVYNNIKKFLMYLLSCNIGEILLMAVAILFGPLIGIPSGVLPLIAIQILWVNLATDGLPALALSVDPPDPDLMSRRPRRRGDSIFSRPVIRFLAGAGIWTAIVSLLVFLWALNSGRSFIESQCMCFVTLILIQFFNAVNCRSEKHSIFKIGLLSNKWLLLAIAGSLSMTVMLVYVPFLQEVFHTYALSAVDWGIAIVSASSILIVVEIGKLISNRYSIN